MITMFSACLARSYLPINLLNIRKLQQNFKYASLRQIEFEMCDYVWSLGFSSYVNIALGIKCIKIGGRMLNFLLVCEV